MFYYNPVKYKIENFVLCVAKDLTGYSKFLNSLSLIK